MKKNKIFITGVHINDEYFDGIPTAAFIEITPDLKKIILKAQEVILTSKKNGLDIFEVRLFSYAPEFVSLEDEPEEDALEITEKQRVKLLKTQQDDVRIETGMLSVTDDEFHFDAYIKHTNVLIETKSIEISKL